MNFFLFFISSLSNSTLSVSSGSSRGSLSTGSRGSLSASSRGSLSSLNQSVSNPDGLHLLNGTEHFSSLSQPPSTTCPPIYEVTRLESSSGYNSTSFPTSVTTSQLFSQSKGSILSRDSLSYSSLSPPVSPMHSENINDAGQYPQWVRNNGELVTNSVHTKGESSQYIETNGMERNQPFVAVSIKFSRYVSRYVQMQQTRAFYL